jgi:hypothetical protein
MKLLHLPKQEPMLKLKSSGRQLMLLLDQLQLLLRRSKIGLIKLKEMLKLLLKNWPMIKLL